MGTPSNRYAGFWKRFVATVIDGVLLGIVNFIILIPFFGLMGLGAMQPESDTFGHEELFLIAALSAYLFSMGHGLKWQQGFLWQSNREILRESCFYTYFQRRVHNGWIHSAEAGSS